MADDVQRARCRGCGGFLKHEVLPGYEQPDGTVERIPSWHAECIPEELRSGGRLIRKGGTKSATV